MPVGIIGNTRIKKSLVRHYRGQFHGYRWNFDKGDIRTQLILLITR